MGTPWELICHQMIFINNNHTTLIHNPFLLMFNSSSLILQRRSCCERESISFFHILLIHLHRQWPIMDSILTISLLPLLLFFFTSFLLPKLLWSLQTRINKASLVRYDHVDEMKGLYCDLSDDDGCGKGDLFADIVGDGVDILFLPLLPTNEEEVTLLLEQAKTNCGSCYEEDHGVPPIQEEDLTINITIQDITVNHSEFHSPLTYIADKEEEDDHDVPKQEENILQGLLGHVMVDQVEVLEKEKVVVDEEKEEEHLTDTCTNGSSSKSSCEWRRSCSLRESRPDGFFSSSSRRSSSQWESYTVYRKYDEDMMFFDRISSQKLKETESLRSIKVQPRSISERIAHKLSTKNRRRIRDPYHGLEAAYVAQVCLAWEAISWNYHIFRKHTACNTREEEHGCPAHVAQQFQQFLVLLQRFVENEPYEYGRRPKVYARLRISSPRLLQVPEFHGDDTKEAQSSRIASPEFLKIMEDIIRTFMKFLEADKERHWQALKALLRRSKSNTVDLNRLNFIKSANKKKKAKLKELQKGGNCMRKMKLKAEEEMEVFMCLVDVKVVSRVLRMLQINETQLQWCEEKMRRVRVSNGWAQRDPTPLFFPAQGSPFWSELHGD